MNDERGERGTVYLLHFEPAYRHARHRFGFTSQQLRDEIERHWSGRARGGLVRAALDAGCRVVVARTWSGTASDAARLRRSRSAAKYCPRCRALKKAQKQDENLEVLLERSIERARRRRG